MLPSGSSVAVSAQLVVAGNMTVEGTLVLSPVASVTAAGVVVAGSLQVSQGATLAAGELTILPGATLTPVVTTHPGSGKKEEEEGGGEVTPVAAPTVTVAVASFSSMSGQFVVAPAVASFEQSQCVALGSPTVVTTASTLSAVMSVTQLCDNQGLSTGAIVGIAVGCVAGAIVLAVLIVVVTVLRRRQRDAAIRGAAAAQMLAH